MARFLLRYDDALHRHLRVIALNQGVSLNQLITRYCQEGMQRDKDQPAAPWPPDRGQPGTAPR